MQSPAEANGLSFFKPMGYQKNSCGYCKKKSGSCSYYATSTKVLPQHYQELVDRGWRRSGTIYYKQDLTRSCCPHYTIRMDAELFRSKKDQRQAINRWNKFILGQEYIRKAARLCPRTREAKKILKNHFDLQSAVHLSEYHNIPRPIDPATKKPLEPSHKFEVTIEPDHFSREKWDLFLRYQTKVHKEPSSRWKQSSFQHFLCSGMARTGSGATAKDKRIGSYHQCYRLDGKLVAIAVLDLLPTAVSSVYLIYEPDMGQWEFGKLSAIREMAMAVEDEYRYYYMGLVQISAIDLLKLMHQTGYYIHSCTKMRYKIAYQPQYILDPESLTWDLFDEDLRKKLDANNYVSLSRDRKAKRNDGNPLESETEATVHEPDNLTDKVEKTSTEPLSRSAEGEGEEGEEGEDSESDWEDPGCSLFDLNMPGIMTKEEVETQIDLDHWRLHDRNMFIEMEDLVGWETSNIMNPQAIKGIIGELAAVLGPKVVKESAVTLF